MTDDLLIMTNISKRFGATQALKDVLPDQSANDASHPAPSIIIRKGKEQAPLAASLCWDGGAGGMA